MRYACLLESLIIGLSLLPIDAVAAEKNHKQVHRHETKPKHKAVHRTVHKPVKKKPGKKHKVTKKHKPTKKHTTKKITRTTTRSSKLPTKSTTRPPATSSSAVSDDPAVLYKGLTAGALVPYAQINGTNTAFNYSSSPEVHFNLNGQRPGSATLDTGSSAFLVGSAAYPGFNATTFAEQYEVAYEFLSSTDYLYTGYFVPTIVNLVDADVSSNISVLVVTSKVICSGYPDTVGGPCPAAQINSTICDGNCTMTYMGIGFGRYLDGQESESPANNVMLNVISINGQPVPNLRQGYILTDQGIWTGITQSNSANFTLVKLTPTGRGYARDWNQVTGCITIYLPDKTEPAGACVNGEILLDTGIAQSYLELTPDSGWENWTAPEAASSTGLQYALLPGGARVEITFGEQRANGSIKNDFDYSYTVGSNASSTPSFARAVLNETVGAQAFVNTGINFYRSNSILFDAVGGYWGISAQ